MKTLCMVVVAGVVGTCLTGCDAQMDNAVGKVDEAVHAAEGTAGELAASAEGAVAAAGEEFTAATEKATAAMEGVEGGSELLTKVKDLFASATTALSDVTNEETATAAAPKLGALSLNADSLKPLLDKLPEAAKTAIMGLIEKGLPQLKALAEKALKIPGVEAVLKPKLDELLGKLQGLAGKAP